MNARNSYSLFAALLVAESALPVYAQSTGSGPALEEIVVIGSNQANVPLEAKTPVDIVSADELQTSGAPTLIAALQKTIPSFNFPQSLTTGSEAWGQKQASIGGLNPNYTLVLVDGKRYHPAATVKTLIGFDQGSQAADLDSIPFSAIERVEVLRAGASAQYGADAVAGVINIVLRKSRSGNETTATIGQYSSGKGLTKDLKGWAATELTDRGFLNFNFTVNQQDPFGSGAPDTRQYYASGDPREQFVNRDVYGSGKPDRLMGNALINARGAITDRLDGYGYVGYSWKHATVALVPLRPTDDGNVRSVYPNGVQTLTDTYQKDAYGLAGLKFEDERIGKFDLSYSYGYNTESRYLLDTINASLGAASPTDFYVGEFKATQGSAELDYLKNLEVGYADQPLTLSAGVAYLHEKWEELPGDALGYYNGGVPILDGPNAGNAAPTVYPPGNGIFRDQDAGEFKRHVSSAYLAFEQDVTEKLNLGLAARFEDYSDFGSKTTGKFSARYEFVPAFAIRGSASTGFSAPTLGQVGISQSTAQLTQGQNSATRLLPTRSAAAQLLGATDLKAQTSRNYGLGFVWRPLTNASLTADFYRIEIDDGIVFSATLNGPYVRSVLDSAGYTDIVAANYFANAIDLKTDGVDIVGQYSLDFDSAGTLDLSAAFNRHQIDITHIYNNPVLVAAGLNILTNQQVAAIEESTPNNKLVLGANYKLARLGADLTVTRYGTFTYANTPVAANNQTVSAQVVADLDLNYQLNDSVRLAVGALNLFGEKPDEASAANRPLAYLQNTLFGPTDPWGTFVYGRVSVSF